MGLEENFPGFQITQLTVLALAAKQNGNKPEAFRLVEQAFDIATTKRPNNFSLRLYLQRFLREEINEQLNEREKDIPLIKEGIKSYVQQDDHEMVLLMSFELVRVLHETGKTTQALELLNRSAQMLDLLANDLKQRLNPDVQTHMGYDRLAALKSSFDDLKKTFE